jgi:hypothetical protein
MYYLPGSRSTGSTAVVPEYATTSHKPVVVVPRMAVPGLVPVLPVYQY